MCDCVKEIEDKVLAHVVENKQYEKPVKAVTMQGKIISLSDSMRLRLSTDFAIELEGQKKQPLMPVTWAFCAFCGEKLT